MNHGHASPIAAIAALMGSLLVAMLLAAVIMKVREIRRAALWLETTGRVIASRIKTSRRKPDDPGYNSSDSEMITEPFVEYEYKVDGRIHRCSRITVGEKIPGTEIEATLARYPVGRNVTVFYNPADPKEALLERTLPTGMMVRRGTAVMVVLIGVPLVALLIDFNAPGWLRGRIANPQRASAVTVTALLGVAATWFTVVFAGMVRRASAWPTTKGRITSAEVEAFQGTDGTGYGPPRMVYKPAVIYTYEVRGRTYSGDRLTIGLAVSGSIPALARRTAARYPVGSEVDVHYDPLSPGVSVLKPRSHWHHLLWIVAAALFGFSWAMATGRL